MLNNALDVCKFVNHFDALIVPQIMAWYGYAKNSQPDVNRKLKQYIEDAYLDRKLIPSPKTPGGASFVYKLGERGRELLRTEDIEVPRFTMGHGETISTHYWHTLYVNWFFIQAHLWRNRTPGVEFVKECHELDLKRAKKIFPYYVTWDDGTKHGVIPDGFLNLTWERDGRRRRRCFLLELETGSQAPKVIRQKVQNLALFLSHYQEIFTSSEGVFNGYLFPAMGLKGLSPDNHRKMILRAIAEVLREMEVPDYFKYFKVTSCPIDSPNLFDAPVWNVPAVETGYGDYQAHGLFE